MTNAELQQALWNEYNAGRMPVAIRMAYKLYAEMMCDEGFYEAVELPNEETLHTLTYQGLPVVLDPWYKTAPHIVTEPRV